MYTQNIKMVVLEAIWFYFISIRVAQICMEVLKNQEASVDKGLCKNEKYLYFENSKKPQKNNFNQYFGDKNIIKWNKFCNFMLMSELSSLFKHKTWMCIFVCPASVKTRTESNN